MDLSKVSKGAQVFIGAGFVYLIASFLPWYSIDIPAELKGLIPDTSFNAWGDIGFLWGSLWALLFLAGAVILALPAFGVKAPTLPSVAYLVVAALATLFTLLKLLIGEDDPISASFGIYLAVLAAAGATFGAFLMFKESGGELSHLTDMEKMKGHAGIHSTGTATTPRRPRRPARLLRRPRRPRRRPADRPPIHFPDSLEEDPPPMAGPLRVWPESHRIGEAPTTTVALP